MGDRGGIVVCGLTVDAAARDLGFPVDPSHETVVVIRMEMDRVDLRDVAEGEFVTKEDAGVRAPHVFEPCPFRQSVAIVKRRGAARPIVVLETRIPPLGDGVGGLARALVEPPT